VAQSCNSNEEHLGATELGGSDEENCKLTRARASSAEWKQYYERADRARARYGDPFRVMVERAEMRRRVDGVAAMAIFVGLLGLIGFSLWTLLT
jgi:hypothetical protein